jgi:putative flippase GtrA
MIGQFSRFLTVGALNTALGYATIFGAMYIFKLSAELSNIIGYGVGLTLSFILSKKFTFRSSGRIAPELRRFLAVFTIAYIANFAALFLLLRLPSIHEALCQILAGVAYVAVSYWLNSRYVFVERIPLKSGKE